MPTQTLSHPPPVCLLVHPRPLKSPVSPSRPDHRLPACYHTLFNDFITERERDDGRRVNVVLMRSRLKWWGGGGGGGCLVKKTECRSLCIFKQAGCHMWWNNQVLCVCWLVVNTLSPEETLLVWAWASASRVLSSFRNGGGWCTPRCALAGVCLRMPSVSKPTKELGLIGGFQTSVTLTLMNHTAPGSTCACGCEACLSKLMLLFTRDDPEGPGITGKQKHTAPDMACIFYWAERLRLNTRAVDSWMCASSFVWSDGLISSLTVPFSSVFDSRE